MELHQDDLQTVANFLAPHYNETPEETKNYIKNVHFIYNNTTKSVETRGFILWTDGYSGFRRVNVANHFFRVPKQNLLKTLALKVY